MKITAKKPESGKIKFKTKPGSDGQTGLLAEWWKADDERQLSAQVCSTATYLKENQTYRIRQLAVNIRLYSGMSVYSYTGSNVSKIDRTKTLPEDRPTFNVIQAATDTLVARMSQDEPSPRFLTDGADYRKRHLAQELNQFISGEFYQTKTYIKGPRVLRDMIVTGTGCMKVYRGDDDKVCLDRVLPTDLYVDDNDSLNGEPQTLYQLKLVDRDRLIAQNPTKKAVILGAPSSYPDNSPDSGRTIADQVMVIEAWKLPSGDDPKARGYMPGRHVIATPASILLDEDWNKTKFPFVFIRYSDPFLGFWGQGLATQLFGNQLSINRLNYTISRAILLMGVPRVLVEDSSKISKAYIDNQIGTIIPYRGTAPIFVTANSNAADLYEERDRIIDYAFRQCGVSNMASTGEKPAGLNSGEAIRSYDDISLDRQTLLAKKYQQFYIELAYMITDVAMDIAEDTGKYQTVYPNKDGTKEISLPQMGFLKDPFVIQCFTESSLPRTPAGRIQAVTEMVQSGMLALKEGRRLMNAPDLEENEKLDNSSEERIFQILDNIVQDGEYTPPDPFLDLPLASELVVKYYNLYMAARLEPEKQDMLHTFFIQVQTLIQGSQAPAAPAAPMPTANPEPTPTSPLVPNTNASQPQAA